MTPQLERVQLYYDSYWRGIGLGLFFGACLGIGVTCLCIAYWLVSRGAC